MSEASPSMLIYNGTYGIFQISVSQYISFTTSLLTSGAFTLLFLSVITFYAIKWQNFTQYFNGMLAYICLGYGLTATKNLAIGVSSNMHRKTLDMNNQITGYSFNIGMDYCGSEGYVNYFIFAYQILWSFALIYDLYMWSQQLRRASNSLVWCYNMIICFLAASLSGIMYSIGKANMVFSIGYTYTCSIYPKYHLWLVVLPEIVFIFGSIRVMSKIKKNLPYSKKKGEYSVLKVYVGCCSFCWSFDLMNMFCHMIGATFMSSSLTYAIVKMYKFK